MIVGIRCAKSTFDPFLKWIFSFWDSEYRSPSCFSATVCWRKMNVPVVAYPPTWTKRYSTPHMLSRPVVDDCNIVYSNSWCHGFVNWWTSMICYPMQYDTNLLWILSYEHPAVFIFFYQKPITSCSTSTLIKTLR